jgi:hypothetical protein
MTRPAILNEPEKWVAVPVEPVGYVSERLGHFMALRRVSAFINPVYARPDPTALADLVAYAEGLEWDHDTLKALGVSWRERAETAEARVIELERRLAEAEKVVEPFAQYRTADGIGDGSDFLRIPDGHPLLWNMRCVDDTATMENLIEVRHLRAARAWKENGDE